MGANDALCEPLAALNDAAAAIQGRRDELNAARKARAEAEERNSENPVRISLVRVNANKEEPEIKASGIIPKKWIGLTFTPHSNL